MGLSGIPSEAGAIGPNSLASKESLVRIPPGEGGIGQYSTWSAGVLVKIH